LKSEKTLGTRLMATDSSVPRKPGGLTKDELRCFVQNYSNAGNIH